MIEDPHELALIIKALTSGLSNCVEWINDKTALRIANDPDLEGLSPRIIRSELLAYVREGGEVEQVPEKRSEYKHLRFYYKARIPIEDFRGKIFVEMILSNDDADVPCVSLVNAHKE